MVCLLLVWAFDSSSTPAPVAAEPSSGTGLISIQ
jgi:hypothetical protein